MRIVAELGQVSGCLPAVKFVEAAFALLLVKQLALVEGGLTSQLVLCGVCVCVCEPGWLSRVRSVEAQASNVRGGSGA
jgi:hypothetical protein